MDYDKYRRWEATAKSTGERCGRPAIGPHGKCGYQDGKSPKGEDHPFFEHGFFPDYLSENDRETIAALEKQDDAEKLEEVDVLAHETHRSIEPSVSIFCLLSERPQHSSSCRRYTATILEISERLLSWLRKSLLLPIQSGRPIQQRALTRDNR